MKVPKQSFWQSLQDWRRMPADGRTPLIEWLHRVLFRRNCGNCRYFEYEKDNSHGIGKIGQCVRHPPSIHDTVINSEFDLWPTVFSEESVCGEHRRGRRISQ